MIEIKTFMPRMDGKTDSFFYDGCIAQGVAKDGTIYRLIATGSVCVKIDDVEYKDNERFTAIQTHHLTDIHLNALDLHSDNWFEIIWKYPGQEHFEPQKQLNKDMEYNYDNAIEMLRSYVSKNPKEIIHGIKDQVFDKDNVLKNIDEVTLSYIVEGILENVNKYRKYDKISITHEEIKRVLHMKTCSKCQGSGHHIEDCEQFTPNEYAA